MPAYRFGKHPPKHDYRTLRLKKYLSDGQLGDPPPSYDVLKTVYQNLGTSNAQTLFPMDANDTLGDCTIAAVAHAITVYRGLVEKESIMATKSVTKLYKHLTGGIDSGLNELDVLNYWRQHDIFAERILAFASVDPKNHKHVKHAIHLFGGVYLGFQVQENCIADFDARREWTPAPLTQEGHAVYATAYDAHGLTVLTWGNTQRATWGWWDECVDEAYAILPPQAKQKTFAAGFDFAQLQTDLSEVAMDA